MTNSKTNQSNSLRPAKLTTEQVEALLKDPEMLREMTRTLVGFINLALPHYLTLEPADFHPELIGHLSDETKQFLAIVGFRGSAKSSLAAVALPLWAALERKSPFTVLFNETSDVAKLTIANIRHELEDNEIIHALYGDVTKGVAKTREWTKTNLLLNNGTRILGRSRGQKIRGLRHREHRPSLVVLDDPEELEKVQQKDYRDKTERWLRSDLIPAIEETKARLVVIGNILHTDALMARLKLDSIFDYHEYPLLKDGKVTWKAKYPTQAHIDRQQKKAGHTAWMREYLLKVVPPEGQIIKEEWLQYYDKIPTEYEIPDTQFRSLVDKNQKQTKTINPIIRAGVGVDLAISKKQSADYTAMVQGIVADDPKTEKRHVYILPRPTNEHLTFHETKKELIRVDKKVRQYAPPTFFIESVQYQAVAIEEARRIGIAAQPMKTGQDKRARLIQVAMYVEDGTVLFPRTGCEDLIAQLTGFGIEEHDDLADAFAYLLTGLWQESINEYEDTLETTIII